MRTAISFDFTGKRFANKMSEEKSPPMMEARERFNNNGPNGPSPSKIAKTPWERLQCKRWRRESPPIEAVFSLSAREEKLLIMGDSPA
jgi:hypothetical protein